MPANDLRPAVRALAWLWLLTSCAYLASGQSGLGWFQPFPLLPKAGWALLNCLACALVLRFPGRVSLILLTALVAVISQLAWHSWLGAMAPFVPLFFFSIALLSVSSPEQRRAAVELSMVLLTIALLAHRCNLVYLSGFEFSSEGRFSKVFPLLVRDWLALHAEGAAIFWMVLTLLPLAFYFVGAKRIALWFFLAHGLLAAYLYDTLFYGFFLLVPLLLSLDPDYLRNWRWSRGEKPRWAPWHLYLAGQMAFFSWYSFWKEGALIFWLLTAAILLCLALAKPAELPKRLEWRARPVLIWLGFYCLFLAAPFAFTTIPPPFMATYFSAREARYPPLTRLNFDSEFYSCEKIRKETAQRWGYEVVLENNTCFARTYR